MDKPVFEIDGLCFDSLDRFYDVFGEVVLNGTQYGRNLDALNDVLRGGFGTPDGGFILRWKNAHRSKEQLGIDETIRYLERKLTTCHPLNVQLVQDDLLLAQRGIGETLFEIICDIVRNHGPGGDESEDGVILELQ